MAALAPMNTAVFYYCDQCNRFIPPKKSSAIETNEEDNPYIFSWKTHSVTWKKECGTFRVSFFLNGKAEVLKEMDRPRKHACLPEHIWIILQSIRNCKEEPLSILCSKNLNLHKFRDSQGRSIFHLVVAKCFNKASSLLIHQGKINLLAYLCTDHNPSTFKDAEGRTPLELARAYRNQMAIDAFTQAAFWS